VIAHVVGIESATQYSDGHRRIMLKFDAGDAMFNKVRFDEHALGIVGLRLDDRIEVTMCPVAAEAIQR
jgi:hypothetical protein